MKIYGYSKEGMPLKSQKEVLRDYFIHNPGKENALSHSLCEKKFGFKRLSAIVWDLENEDCITVSRETRVVPTRYADITSTPMFYWVEEDEAEAHIGGSRCPRS